MKSNVFWPNSLLAVRLFSQPRNRAKITCNPLVAELTYRRTNSGRGHPISTVKDHLAEAIYSVDELRVFEGTFDIASIKKELKAMMTSNTNVFCDADKGKCF